jgi:hypothetical protein
VTRPTPPGPRRLGTRKRVGDNPGSVPNLKPDYSFEDYLGAERECTDAKHEYVAGQVFAMTGATYHHNHLTETRSPRYPTLPLLAQ